MCKHPILLKYNYFLFKVIKRIVYVPKSKSLKIGLKLKCIILYIKKNCLIWRWDRRDCERLRWEYRLTWVTLLIFQRMLEREGYMKVKVKKRNNYCSDDWSSIRIEIRDL